MSYTLDYIEDKKIVRIGIQGVVNFKMAKQYSERARKLAQENNCKKFLFDHTRTLLEAGIYKIHMDGDTLEKFGFSCNDKIAIIISGDENNSRFSQITDPNVKWSNFKYFNDFDKAENWLAEDH